MARLRLMKIKADFLLLYNGVFGGQPENRPSALC